MLNKSFYCLPHGWGARFAAILPQRVTSTWTLPHCPSDSHLPAHTFRGDKQHKHGRANVAALSAFACLTLFCSMHVASTTTFDIFLFHDSIRTLLGTICTLETSSIIDLALSHLSGTGKHVITSMVIGQAVRCCAAMHLYTAITLCAHDILTWSRFLW